MIAHLMDIAAAGKHTPRVHGNGFIQLDITEQVRLHIWGHPMIPRQTIRTPIHDHTFAFVSLVLKGAMHNKTYIARPTAGREASHEAYQAEVRSGEDTVLRPTGKTYLLLHEHTEVVTVGQFYSLEPPRIHESIVTDPTATLIMKNAPTLAQGGKSPRVFVPLNTAPDNDFNRHGFSEAQLWRIIREVIG